MKTLVKENIKKMAFFLVASSLILTIMGCQFETEVKQKGTVKEITNEKENLSSKVNDLDDDAKSDIRDAETIGKDNIVEGISYIKEHIKDPFTENEVTEKMIYYSAYLKNLGSKTVESSKQEITSFGENTFLYMTNIYERKETENSKKMTALKEKIELSLENIQKDENGIDTFQKMIAK
ncbi:MAG: hypothetical protein PHN72_03180 [Bacilli bacterium]|nr:hypothetical protein [Bacilli bacterium]